MIRKEKRPRMYAQEIIGLPDRQQRKEALEKVPEKFREWVRGYVERYFYLKRKRG